VISPKTVVKILEAWRTAHSMPRSAERHRQWTIGTQMDSNGYASLEIQLNTGWQTHDFTVVSDHGVADLVTFISQVSFEDGEGFRENVAKHGR
jgi:hypothetical protein